MTLCMFRQGSIVAVTSSIFCCLISEFFDATGQTSSSVSILFYFLTPCLVELNHLMRIRKVKSILALEVADLKSYYQVEIKCRFMLADIEAEKAKHKRAIYGDERPKLAEDDLETNNAKSIAQIDDLFDKA